MMFVCFFLAFSAALSHSVCVSISPKLPFTAAKIDCLKDEREGRGQEREGWREGGRGL